MIPLAHYLFKRPDLNYHDYIKSPEWKYKAQQIREEYGNRCQLCHASGYTRQLHVHHNTYERLGNELKDDLILLCAKCHELYHKHSDETGARDRLSREDFLTVLRFNGITWANKDPYHFYELGKFIIQHIIDGLDAELYDYYNKINIEVLDAACANRARRERENE